MRQPKMPKIFAPLVRNFVEIVGEGSAIPDESKSTHSHRLQVGIPVKQLETMAPTKRKAASN